MSVTRTRVIPFGPFAWKADMQIHSNSWPYYSEDAYSGVVGSASHLSNLQGGQVTVSHNHPEWRRRGKRQFANQDIGGDFFSSSFKVVGKITPVDLYGSDGYQQTTYRAHYHGPYLPISPPNYSFPQDFPVSSDAHMDALGTSAIAVSKPTNSVADASIFLGEMLREGLPNLGGTALKKWRDGTEAARKVPAKEYLNYEFGWKPIYNDVNKFIYAVQNADAVMKQYERDAGKLVRRKVEISSDSWIENIQQVGNQTPWIAFGLSPLDNRDDPSHGACWRLRTVNRRQWFAGGFMYFLPSGYYSGGGMSNFATRARKLYGLSLDPATVWNLAPWSWAADWFSNAGDLASNLADWASDGLVLKYGYVMEETSVSDLYTYMGPTGYQSDVRPSDITLTKTVKLRRKATPFGFGFDWGGLSLRQSAILVALGITRS